MRSINSAELKSIQLEILNVVAEFCNSNEIKYFLCYGTLLGAVRHQGYIPWDDDIDIAMLRSDYEKFVSSFNFYNCQYKVYTVKNTSCFPFPFAKVAFENSIIEELSDNMKNNIGINIDIFPIDDIPNNTVEQKKLMHNIRTQRGVLDAKAIVINSKRDFYKNAVLYFAKLIFKFIKPNEIVNRIIKLAAKYNDSQSENVGVIVWGYGEREIVSRNLFKEQVKMKFEGNYYSVPKGYHEWLSSIYGDYMELPPVEKRISHHGFKAYVIND